VGESPNVARVRTMKLRRRFAGESRGRCLLTNLAKGQGATLWAVGNERRASLVTRDSGCRASHGLAKAAPAAESLADTVVGSSGVVATARKERGCTGTGEALLAPRRKTSEKGRRWQQRRRPEGGRWARSSSEPPVTRRDPAMSRGAEREVSPRCCKGARLVDIP